MKEQFSRTERLLGEAGMERLYRARVAVFGVGGVGGHAAEALARSGVGALDLIDSDRVCLSNLNRQIIATTDKLGMYKADAMAERVRSINPDCRVRVFRCFFLPETAGEFDFRAYDYVVDAVDTVTAKIALVLAAQEAGTPVISCMGAGNKLDATRFEVADIYETSVCPLAKVMRRELRKRGVHRLKVVYSKEEPIQPFPEDGQSQAEAEAACEAESMTETKNRSVAKAVPDCAQDKPRVKSAPGSVAFVPSVAGLILAGAVVRDLAGV